jgi:folate-binding protein YgfZ
MKAALLPDRGVIKVAGDDAGNFLHGLVSADVLKLTAGQARFCALLTPQGKIIVDFIVVAASAAQGSGFLIDVPRTLTTTLVQKLNLYKLRSRVMVEDLSEILAIIAVWDGPPSPYPPPQAGEEKSKNPPALVGEGRERVGLAYADPRLPALGLRLMVPPHLAAAAAAERGAELVAASAYEAHRIALGIPSGGLDFGYSDAFPHEADMDQLGGVDFTKGCYVGQEVVSRMEHRGIARTRTVPVRFDGDAAPAAGAAVMAGERQVGTMGSAADGHGLALLRLDRVADAISAGLPLLAGGIAIHPVKPDWVRFAFPGETKAAE